MAAADILTGATSAAALELKVFMEVKEAFDRSNVFLNKITSKTIESGGSAQFIIGGKDGAIAKTHARTGGTTTIGGDIAVNPVKMDERVIVINDTVYDARELDGREEKIAQYEARGPITNMIGEVLARNIDTQIVAKMGKAAETTGLAGNPDAPAVIVNTTIVSGSTSKEKGDALAESIFAGVAALKENDVMGEVYVAVSPTNYSYLVQSGNGVNADYTSGNGGFDTGSIMKVGGAIVVESTNIAAATNIESPVGFVFTSECVGLVSLIGLTTESNYDYRRFSTLLTGRFAIGVDVLRPEAIVALASAAQV